MKKVLFMILSISMLNGMEPEYKQDYMGSLPKEVQGLIISALKTGNNLTATINAIKNLRAVSSTLKQMIDGHYGDIGNLQGFTKIVHILADKFNTSTQDVANKFGTSIAREYNQLASAIGEKVFFYNPDYSDDIDSEIIKFINDGADVNFTLFDEETHTNQSTLKLAFDQNRQSVVQLLLNAGANPNFIEGSQEKTLNYIKTTTWVSAEIVKLIKDAMEKLEKKSL